MIIKNLEVLNSKKTKEVTKLLAEQWGYTERLECGILQRENDIFLATRAIDRVDLRSLNVNSLGLYFGELRANQLRLSIEGSQIIGQKAKKNVIELNEVQITKWLRGEDIELENNTTAENYALVSSGKDFYGCGRIKDGKLLNFVPKARRVKT
ncbi:hypothetical protein HYU12_01860 [Candidatus Woesearchaeota archaeon]|nr:hypothetical protein [Candidatus Woesearchaeota archaeon]